MIILADDNEVRVDVKAYYCHCELIELLEIISVCLMRLKCIIGDKRLREMVIILDVRE